jgi:hypothetical protein
MQLTPPDDTGRTPAQGFQSEGAEHAPEVTETLLPAAAYQHEDDIAGPAMCITAGRSSSRMMNASMKTAAPKPTPIIARP